MYITHNDLSPYAESHINFYLYIIEVHKYIDIL